MMVEKGFICFEQVKDGLYLYLKGSAIIGLQRTSIPEITYVITGANDGFYYSVRGNVREILDAITLSYKQVTGRA